MKLFIAVGLSFVLLTPIMGTGTRIVLDSEDTKSYYALGYQLGENLKLQNGDLAEDVFLSGLKDGFSGVSQLSDRELSSALVRYQQLIKERQKEQSKLSAGKNQMEGEKFLAENKTRKGVIVRPSGLQYEVLKKGKGGVKPKPTNKVKVHYKGSLINGTEFDSSYSRGKPAEFGVTQVIPGWVEALQLMQVGDKWRLFIPSNLAYGPQGAGRLIGPNATLIFDVELLDIIN